jgi:predicted O-linked N-acetylglucosamine transferase (SPINDLY family)
LVDLSKMSDHAAATEVYKLRPHIGVLLDGYASADRIAVMAMRPAPIQLSYISQGTSTGSSSFIRYALTDAVLSPPSQLGLWTERLTMLPVAHVNDYWRLRREVNLQPIKVAEGRDDYGLPARRFVMSNQAAFSRMDPTSFHSWCNLLGRLPNATLWLNRPNDRSEELMEQQLAACGAARDNRKRIHFSNAVARDEQVRRGGISDLSLDTPMHSGHTASVESLWSGTPVATVLKHGAMARSAVSAMSAAQMGTLALPTHKEMEDTIVQMVTGPRHSAPRSPWSGLGLFRLQDWVDGGLNPLFQRYKKHDLSLSTK